MDTTTEQRKARHRDYMRAKRAEERATRPVKTVACAECSKPVRWTHGGQHYCCAECRKAGYARLNAQRAEERKSARRAGRPVPIRKSYPTSTRLASLTPDILRRVALAKVGLLPDIPRVYYQATEGRPYSPHVVQEHWGRNGGRV